MTTLEKPQRSMVRLVGGAAAAKVLVMGMSGVLGIITSHVIIASFGTAAYAQYGLLTSLPSLLPFADLGIAAVVINVVASSPDVRTDETVRRTIMTAFRILLLSGAIIALVGVTISVLGLWPAILGNGLLPGSGPLVALVCLIIFGFAIPLTVGQRVLVGLNRTTTQIATQAVVAPFMLLCIGGCVLLGLKAQGAISIFSFVASALVSLLCLVMVRRAISPQLARAIRDVPRLRSVKSVPILSTSWPMLAQMLALPIAMQTDRLLISHLTHGPQLAQYNLASQLFGIVLQTINAAGLPLWPIFARARSRATVTAPWRPTMWFVVGGLSVGLVLGLLSPLLAQFVSSGRIHLDGWLVGGFVVFVALQAAKYPVGMYMTDKRGLKFQVWPILVLVPVNLALSWYLVGVIGAGGTIIGSAISVFFCQLIPNLIWVRRDLVRRRRLELPLATELALETE